MIWKFEVIFPGTKALLESKTLARSFWQSFGSKPMTKTIDESNYTTTFVAYQLTLINSWRKAFQNFLKKGKTVRQCATPEVMADETTRKQ